MGKIDYYNPKIIYITRDLHDNWRIHFDEPILEDNGQFYSKNGQWDELDTRRWDLNLEKGHYLKFKLTL